jgi:hypothetical protein
MATDDDTLQFLNGLSTSARRYFAWRLIFATRYCPRPVGC